jgi:pilus assembly protein FimV
MDLELSADAGDTSIDFVDVGVPDLNFTSTSTGGDELDLDFGSEFGAANGDRAEDQNRNDGTANVSGISTVSIGSADLDFDLGESDSAATMESPTLDVMGAGSPTLAVDFDFDGGETMESPTLASPANEPTLESPTLDVNAAGAETSEMPSLHRSSGNQGIFDREPLVDPTGLDIDLSGLADLPIDGDDFAALNTGGAVPASDSSSPVFADDNKRISPETENFFLGEDAETALANLESWGKFAGDTLQVSDDPVASDTLQQPQFSDGASDTAEQPGIADPVDFDLGLPDEPKFGDDSTMTEVGTKLDLARAYIDMGDQDGARSILEEVLDEGGEAQQQQARQLLNELND